MDSDSKQVRKVKKVKFDRNVDQRAAIKPSDLSSASGATQTPKPTQVPKPTAAPTTSNAQATTQATTTSSSSNVVTLEQFINAYLKGVSLKQSVYGSGIARKDRLARGNFRIPSGEELYLILDTSLLGTCRTGLALGSKGIYFVDDRGRGGGIGWNSIKSYKLACSNTVLAIGDYRFTSYDSAVLGKLLAEIQARLA